MKIKNIINDNPNIYRWLTIGVVVVASIILITQVWYRPIDRDEGFFIGGAQLIKSGYRIYEDFAFFHPPLLPHIYSILFEFTTTSIITGRLFNVIITISLLLMLYLWLRRRDHLNSLISLILLTSSYVLINWHIPIKAYAITTLLLFLFYIFISSGREGNLYYILFGGIFGGLATSARSLSLPLLVVVFIYLLFRDKRASAPLIYLMGVVVGLTPVIIELFASTDAFLFNNLHIHLKAVGGYVSQFERFLILREFLTQPDTIFLFIASILASIKIFKKEDTPDYIKIALLFALTMFISNLIPNSSQPQYHTSIFPYLAILAGWLILDLRYRFKAKWLPVIFFVLYVISGLARPLGRIYLNYHHLERYGISEVCEVSDVVEGIADDETITLTWWSGYVTEGIVQPEMLLALFTTRVSHLLDEDELERYKLMDDEKIHKLMKSGKCDIIIEGIDTPEDFSEYPLDSYREIERVNTTRIYKLVDG